jgi:hypothetical protein
MANPKIVARPPIALYVDIDGVLHHEEVLWSSKRGIYMCPQKAPSRVLFEWAHYLADELSRFQEVALVLSSSWCRRPGYGETMKRLPLTLRERFVGGTYHRRVHGMDPWALTQFLALSRGAQVLQDVGRRKPLTWLALDDDAEGWPQVAFENLVKCDGATGLSAPNVREELHLKLEKCRQTLLVQ